MNFPVPKGGKGPGALPLLIVQVSHRPIHQLVGCPLQGHDVSCLVKGKVPWHSLHVIPLQREKDSGLVTERVTVEGGPGSSDSRAHNQTRGWVIPSKAMAIRKTLNLLPGSHAK